MNTDTPIADMMERRSFTGDIFVPERSIRPPVEGSVTIEQCDLHKHVRLVSLVDTWTERGGALTLRHCALYIHTGTFLN